MYVFETQPDRYYYRLVGQLVEIPCRAVLEREDGSTQIVEPTLFVDSLPADLYPSSSDSRYFGRVEGGDIVGFLLTPIMLEDSGKTFEVW